MTKQNSRARIVMDSGTASIFRSIKRNQGYNLTASSKARLLKLPLRYAGHELGEHPWIMFTWGAQ